jgi:hypothetical protein
MTYSSRLGVIAAVVFATLAYALPAYAALRSPQVPVSGTALQSFFTAHGQSINASAAQQDIQQFSIPISTSFQVQLFNASATFGAYNASDAVPALYQVVPGAASTGWFAEASFRTSPQRMVVNLFDATSTLVGTNTYLSADNTDLGFYAQDAVGGAFYTQDARNAGGAPGILVYSATGGLAGSTWFACETSGGPGGDFADVIALVNFAFAPVPTATTSWSRVKALYK